MRICSQKGCSKKFFAKGFCIKHYNSRWYAANAKEIAKKKRRQRRTPHGRYVTATCTARSHGHSWELSFEQYNAIVQTPCHYGKTIHFSSKGGIGLDRLDHRKDYSFGNVVSCCGEHNTIKGHLETAGFIYPRTVELMRELDGRK